MMKYARTQTKHLKFTNSVVHFILYSQVNCVLKETNKVVEIYKLFCSFCPTLSILVMLILCSTDHIHDTSLLVRLLGVVVPASLSTVEKATFC